MEKKKYISEIPELMKEWDWEANVNLDPTKLTIGSNKKAWWICHLCGHKWQATIYHRAQNGRSCPHCHHGRWLKGKKNLTELNPLVVKNWHPSKNGNLTPNLFSKNSRYLAWWRCSECGREWQQEISGYRGCIICNRKHRLSENCLAKKFPVIAKSWHPTKNGNLTPNDVFCTAQKVWWKCNKCGYEWKARIDNRIHNRGCPCCANKKVVVGKNDLATTHPELAREWHPTKNGNLTPKDVTYGYGKKVWWQCPQGHDYQATVNHRTCDNGTNCPICHSGRQTSFAEQAFYFYIKKMYPDAINRYKADFLGKMELDIFIPSINIAIEYDGMAWHKENKLIREEKKYLICKLHEIRLIRLKERKGDYSNIADQVIVIKDLYKSDNLNRLIPRILEQLDPDKIIKSLKISNNSLYPVPLMPDYDVNVKRDKIKILKNFVTNIKKGSFGELYPELAREWHKTKNEGLTPFMFKPMSDHKVWWICSKCGYEYQAAIGHRTYGYGCMKCGIEKSTQAKRKAVHMINPKTNKIVKTFISIADAARETKLSHGNIGLVCQGIRHKTGGYIWRYADEQETQKYRKDKKQLEFDFRKNLNWDVDVLN